MRKTSARGNKQLFINENHFIGIGIILMYLDDSHMFHYGPDMRSLMDVTFLRYIDAFCRTVTF